MYSLCKRVIGKKIEKAFFMPFKERSDTRGTWMKFEQGCNTVLSAI